jgi:hypothetical protein
LRLHFLFPLSSKNQLPLNIIRIILSLNISLQLVYENIPRLSIYMNNRDCVMILYDILLFYHINSFHLYSKNLPKHL